MGLEAQIKRWTRVEYDQLIEKGVFRPDDHIELIDGLLVVAEPQSAYHYTAIGLVVRALTRAFGEGWTIRSQGPLALDREHKSSLYARAGRHDYWIVNLVDRVLEVRRDPAPSPSAPYGWDYRAVDVLGPDENASPLAAPAAWIAVADLLP